MSEQKRVAVFVDWANVFRGTVLDVYKFKEFLEKEFGPFVGFVYMIDFTNLQKEEDPAEAKRSPEGFWARIRQCFVLKLKKVKVIQRGEGRSDVHKADWDVGMTLDIFKTAQSGKIDEIVVFSGDGDFEPLYSTIRNPPHLIKITIVARGKSTAKELYQCTDRIVDLEEHLPKFSKPFEGRPRREIVEAQTQEPEDLVDPKTSNEVDSSSPRSV